jgi:hypothetical protein
MYVQWHGFGIGSSQLQGEELYGSLGLCCGWGTTKALNQEHELCEHEHHQHRAPADKSHTVHLRLVMLPSRI